MTAVLPTNILNAHRRSVSQGRYGVEDPNLPQPTDRPHAISQTAGAPNFPDTHAAFVRSQTRNGVGDSNSDQPIERTNTKTSSADPLTFPDAHRCVDSHGCSGVGVEAGTETAQTPNESHAVPGGLGPILADPTLAMCADVVDDLEQVKIANQNRLRTLTTDTEYGHGLSIDHPDVKRLADIVAALEAAEHQAVLNLQRVMRKHPLGPWVKSRNGIGEKQAARLLAAIRDPYWNDLHNRPRKLRELYRYCGMDVVGTGAQENSDSHQLLGAGVAPHKQRGERVTWSPDARMRLWLIADKCVMITSSPYRAVYDEGRLKYADGVHATECKRCGPKGKPALPGSPLSAGHQHARARRLIAKAILRDLWTAAKDIHEKEAQQ